MSEGFDSMAMITVKCGCGHTWDVGDFRRGQIVTCPQCTCDVVVQRPAPKPKPPPRPKTTEELLCDVIVELADARESRARFGRAVLWGQIAVIFLLVVILLVLLNTEFHAVVRFPRP